MEWGEWLPACLPTNLHVHQGSMVMESHARAGAGVYVHAKADAGTGVVQVLE